MLLTKYCDDKGIKWFPINLMVKEKEGKKVKTIEPYVETGYRPSVKDFKSDKYKQYKFFEGYKYGVIDTTNIQHIDIDILKDILHYVAFYWKTGPWARLWNVWGFDPAKDFIQGTADINLLLFFSSVYKNIRIVLNLEMMVDEI